jgi:hypothetical protein
MLGVKGPLFVSIGEPKKLDRFLELNPTIPRDKIFVDDLTFPAYDALGFGKFGLGKEHQQYVSRVQFPKIINIFKWWQYVTSILTIGPFQEGEYGIPEGGLKLGGTFIVKGDDVVYEWRDKLPGDLPIPSDILAEMERFVEA